MTFLNYSIGPKSLGMALFYIVFANLGAVFLGFEHPHFLILNYALLFIPYLYFLYQTQEGKWGWKEILVVGFSTRILLTLIDPVLSDDLYRYVWEGRVVFEGLSPYANAPDAKNLMLMRDTEIWPFINHKEIPAIYPPIAQFFFAGIAFLKGGLTTMRLGFIGVEALGIFAMYQLLKRYWTRNRLEYALAIYALNPLVLYEIAWSGHLDVLAWTPLILSLAILVYREGWKWIAIAAVLMAASIAAKLIGLILLPLVFFRPRHRDQKNIETKSIENTGIKSKDSFYLKSTAFIVIVVASFSLAYVPFLKSGHLLDGFGSYAKSWKNNEGYFRTFEKSARIILMDRKKEADPIYHFSQFNKTAMVFGFTKIWEGKTVPNTSFSVNQIVGFLAKLIAALAMASMLVLLLLLRRDVISSSLLLLFFLYMVAPTVMPWYIAWLVPFAAITGHRPSILFSFMGLLGYTSWILIHSGGIWEIPDWVIFIEYGTVTAGVIFWRNFPSE